jgi:GNAT superfamily N-acetyltransferase
MDTKKQIDYIPVNKLPVEKVIEILTLALGQDNEVYKKSEALWQWKHLNSPFGPSYGIAAVDMSNQQIASVRLLMYWDFENSDFPKIRCTRAVDVSTHPDYRRKGIFTTLTQMALNDVTDKGAAMIYATPKLKGKSIGGYLKLGFEMIDPWPVYVKILNPLNFLKGITIGRRKYIKQFVPEWGDVFRDNILSFKELSNRFAEKSINDFLIRSDQNRLKNKGWRIKKDLNYIKWRYGSHPNIDYGFLPVEKEGIITGLGILRRNKRYGITEVVISEVLFGEAGSNIENRILRTIYKSVKADYLIAHFNKGTTELKALKRNCFIKAPGQEIVFLIKGLAAGKEKFDKHEYWNFSLGDIELF